MFDSGSGANDQPRGKLHPLWIPNLPAGLGACASLLRGLRGEANFGDIGLLQNIQDPDDLLVIDL
jgi:hypothetical protein